MSKPLTNSHPPIKETKSSSWKILILVIIFVAILALIVWLIFRSNKNQPICSATISCPIGQTCVSGLCQTVPCSSTVSCPSGQTCISGVCQTTVPVPPCSATVSCPPGQTCVSGGTGTVV